jgi:pimeloyl-ACP methyl ester carboxylesterase
MKTLELNMSTHQTAQTHYAIAPDGSKFAYRRLGTSTGTPLLILTHLRGVMDKFDPLIANTLAASRTIILVDFAGVGLSTGEPAMTVKQSADQILQFLVLIDEKEIDLLGFSMGGYVAQLVVLNADPKIIKIRKLILAGTGPSKGPDMFNTRNDLAPHAATPEITMETFRVLFFHQNREGSIALEADT